jgi:hypothetical protein
MAAASAASVLVQPVSQDSGTNATRDSPRAVLRGLSELVLVLVLVMLVVVVVVVLVLMLVLVLVLGRTPLCRLILDVDLTLPVCLVLSLLVPAVSVPAPVWRGTKTA